MTINQAYWIIGSIKHDGNFSFSNNPKLHPNATVAYAEAERLALNSPGKTFVVLKTVRKIVTQAVTVVDL